MHTIGVDKVALFKTTYSLLHVIYTMSCITYSRGFHESILEGDEYTYDV